MSDLEQENIWLREQLSQKEKLAEEELKKLRELNTRIQAENEVLKLRLDECYSK